MVMFQIPESSQSGDESYTPRLTKRHAPSKILASKTYPTIPLQPTTEISNASIKMMRQHNRNVVIIHNVLYPLDSLHNTGTSGTCTTLGESTCKLGDRKLRKKSLLRFSKEALKPGGVLPLPLLPDYLDAEASSRNATLLRVSALSTSRLIAGQTQTGKARTSAQKQRYTARSANICAALSSHPLMAQEAVSFAPESNGITIDTGSIAPIDGPTDHPQKKRRTYAQKRPKFKPVLESTKEECEQPYTRHVPAGVGDTQSPGVGFAESGLSTAEKCYYLDTEREDFIGKCESPERVVDTIYRDRDSARKRFENKTAHLEKRIQTLETDIAAKTVTFDNEIHRARLNATDLRQMRDKNQLLRFREDADTDVTHSPQWVRSFLLSDLTPNTDYNMYHPQKEKVLHHIMYGDTNTLLTGDYKPQKKVEISHQIFHDMQVRTQSTAGYIIDCGSSEVRENSINPQDELKTFENRPAILQPQLKTCISIPELDSTTATKASRQQTGHTARDSVPPQWAEFLSEPSLSSPPQVNDVRSAAISKPNQISDIYPDISLGNEGIQSDQFNSDTLFGLGSPRTQERRTNDRVRISTEETEQTVYDACLMLNLKTWEWSSVPDLQLLDLRVKIDRNDEE